MEKINQQLLSQFTAISYFAVSLAMCTLCADHSVNPFARLAEKPAEVSCHIVTADPFTEDGNALYTHIIQ
jgi:hypothetical protein